jgi:hypothetical protein
MSRRINKNKADNSSTNHENTLWGRVPLIPSALTDGAFVRDMFTELAEAGCGFLEEAPELDSHFLHLVSGEIYWLGTNEIIRIK